MERLRIGIDGFNLAMPNGTGVATYGTTLANTLRRAGHQVEGVFGLDVGRDPDVREVLFYDLLGREPAKKPTRAEIRREMARYLRDALRPRLSLQALDVPISDKVEKAAFDSHMPRWDRLTSAAHLFRIAFMHFGYYKRFVTVQMENPPPIMHWTYPVPVRLKGARNIYTLHDLVPLRLPYTTLDNKTDYRGVVQDCISGGDHICTVSEASRQDIISQFGIDRTRVTNTYQASPHPAVLSARSAEEDASAIEGIFGLPPQSYFLFFGAIEPKKNIGRLLEAYLSARVDAPLVIVGARAWQAEGELKLLAGADAFGRGIASRIVRLDHLPRDLLLRLIRSARAVLFPSLYEGFGLPVLEAMQLGTPVLTSSTSSLPEVAGDAAVFVDPYDVAAIAEGISALDRDASLRTRLSAAGLQQAASFTPERYLARLETMYRIVLRQG